MRLSGLATLLLLYPFFIRAQNPATGNRPPVSSSVQAVLNKIQAADLRGDLSFLSSDALGGRFTPSAGLDVAAEFIASQFRAAGLEPAGDHEFFQTADMVDRLEPKLALPMTASAGAEKFTIPIDEVEVFSSSDAVELDRVPAIVFQKKSLSALAGAELNDKVVIAPEFIRSDRPTDKSAREFEESQAFDRKVSESGAKAEILIGRVGHPRRRLIAKDSLTSHSVPILRVDADQLSSWLQSDASKEERTISLETPAPDDRPVTLKNVIAVLRGSDPKLRDTYVLLTAHYDHIGTRETGTAFSTPQTAPASDQIFNGANDDGSGTVSVIEIAKALAHMSSRPRRSIVFMTFSGEERGEIGSRYYASHPVFPLAETVADINLEQVGRTDSADGPRVKTISPTGYDFSTVPIIMEAAAKATGTTLFFDKKASAQYFDLSDNASLAQRGVPAHSFCVAFDYADYHGLGDEWQKIDYDNMAQVDRTFALTLIKLANNSVAPTWNAANPKTASYREAQAKLKP